MASPCNRGAASRASADDSVASSPRCTASKRMYCNGCKAARSRCRFGPWTPRATSPWRPCSAVRTSTNMLVSRQGRVCRTKAGSAVSRINQESIVVSECAKGRFVVRPAFTHAHPGFEEYLVAEQAFHLQARLGPDFAQAFAALADDDQLLAFALDPDHRADAQQHALRRRLFDEALDLHGRGIRQFLAELTHELLAYEFAGKKALAL